MKAITEFSFTNPSPFVWMLAIAAAAFLLLTVLTLRSRKPLRIPGLRAETGTGSSNRRSLLGWLRARVFGLASDIRILLSQNRDVYRIPWVLMIGDHHSGEPSLGASLVSSPRLKCLMRDPLHRPDLQGWWSFEQGMLVDVDSLVEQTSEREFVAKLMRARPERPLDAVLLCISAHDLIHASDRALLDEALVLHDQLSRFQQHFSFTFPVYVLVTKADEMPGFQEFCSTRTEDELRQMFGWSNPASLESGYDALWIADALEHLRRTLEDIQLAVTTDGGREVDGDVDAFYLFPRRLDSLAAPLTRVLTQIFTVNPYQANFFFRGIYLSGLAKRTVTAEESAAPSVAFLDQLFSEKIFSEHNLARPIRGSIWSRQEEVRRLQKLMLSVFILLLIGLTMSSVALRREVQEIEDILTVVNYESAGNTSANGCTNYNTIERFLVYVSSVDTGLTSLFIPLSWFDRSYQKSIAQLASESTFRDVVFKAFDCKLLKLESDLKSVEPPATDPSDIFRPSPEFLVFVENYLGEVIEFYQATRVWNNFATPGLGGAQRMRDLDTLLRTLYGPGLPRQVQREQDVVWTILDHSNIPRRVTDPATNRLVKARIGRMIEELDERMRQGLRLGRDLLPAMQTGTADVYDVRQFVAWIDWLDREWLFDPEDAQSLSACEKIPGRISDELSKFQKLETSGDWIKTIEARFEATACRNFAEAELATVHLEPLGNLLVTVRPPQTTGRRFAISENWKKERGYLDQLSRLNFMQLRPTRPFVCDPGASAWSIGALQEAGQYMQEFQSYLQSTSDELPAWVSNTADDLAGSSSSASAASQLSKTASTDGSDSTTAGKQANAGEQKPSVASVLEWPHSIVGRGNLGRVTDQILSSAQLDATGSASASSPSSTQVAVRQTSMAFAQANDSFAGLFGYYSDLRMQREGLPVVSCVQRFASRQLTAINALADASSLLEPTQSNSRQLSQGDPLFRFGNASTPDNWWTTEMSRAQTVLDYAKPYVSLLKSTDAEYAGLGQQTQLAQYWGNSIAELQNSVEFGRNDGQVASLKQAFDAVAGATESSCVAAVQALPEAPPGIDFFSARRQSVEKSSRQICGANIQATGSALATRLSREFGTIQGRFPFSAEGVSSEAELVNTRAFFIDYGNNAQAVSRYLLSGTGARSGKTGQQLNLLNGASLFFNSHLAVAGPPARLSVNAVFRSQDSAGSENVVLWKMGSEVESLYRPMRPSDSLSWYYGEPLQVVFRWPAALRPVADPQQSHLRINSTQNEARFTFSGNYALQRLIARHLYQGPVVGSTTPEPIVLRFVVPVMVSNSSGKSRPPGGGADTSQVELFMEISLSTTDSNGRPVPVFVPSILPQVFPDRG